MGIHVVAEPESDVQVLEACRRGDADAQRRLFEAYADRVYSIALRFLKGDEAAAHDVAQEVFVKVFRGLPSFRGDARFSSWLYRIVANACTDELRRGRRFLMFGDLPDRLHERVPPREPADPHPDVQAAMGRLSPALRLTVLLRYFDDLSYEEIAEATGVSPGTVASRLNRAHAFLSRELAHLDSSRTAP